MSIYKGIEPVLLGGSALVDSAVTSYTSWSSRKLKEELDNAFGGNINILKVDELPTTDIDDKTVYLVPNGETTGNNQYDKFMYIDGQWEKINADKDTINGADAFVQLLEDSLDDELNNTSELPVQNKAFNEALGTPMIYGVMWTGGKKTKLTRTDDAAGFEDPVPYYAGMTEAYGSPFDTIMPWAGMEKVEDSEAGTLVKIPKFYYKFTQDGKVLKLQISNSRIPGFFTSPAHADRGDGAGERDFVYVGRYHCAANTYKSTTGVKPQVNITRANARTAIHNLGSGIWQADIAMRLTIQMLYLVEFADWDSQVKIGYGCGNKSASENMGYTDSMTYHTGTMKTNRTTYGVGTQYRWIEGLWDNCYDWLDGCYYNSNGLNVILNPANFSDTTGGTLVGKPSNGFPTVMSANAVGGVQWMYPTTANGAGGTYIPDSWMYTVSKVCLCCGGDFYQGLERGMFFVGCETATASGKFFGCRLMKLS